MRFAARRLRFPAAAGQAARIIAQLTRPASLRSVFANLTNAYCLVAIGASENFNSVFEAELADHIPVRGAAWLRSADGRRACCAGGGEIATGIAWRRPVHPAGREDTHSRDPPRRAHDSRQQERPPPTKLDYRPRVASHPQLAPRGGGGPTNRREAVRAGCAPASVGSSSTRSCVPWESEILL